MDLVLLNKSSQNFVQWVGQAKNDPVSEIAAVILLHQVHNGSLCPKDVVHMGGTTVLVLCDPGRCTQSSKHLFSPRTMDKSPYLVPLMSVGLAKQWNVIHRSMLIQSQCSNKSWRCLIGHPGAKDFWHTKPPCHGHDILLHLLLVCSATFHHW